uniref:Toxin candidate TRINITY_DN27059_c0_g1_i1 n=1 Tax=Pachycerianthus borealis TaxID=2736680 RepID=A0A7G7WYZ9_9CNID|nr:toxin candidate TRINITY_DN27059_c0_g1_i1 [Pachycerianthus borealis]QNH72553.1 toxin candidate TRINITY_DN27059_c0_g1_i1 [Pachycerianthus borealis]
MAKFVFFAALILFLVLENDGASVGSCGDEECKFGSYCSLSASGEPKCVCPMACTMEYRPVCGSDGNTYGNLCNLKVKSCQQKKFITVIKEGACSDDDELKQRIAEDESELESEQFNSPPYLDPELMNTLNPEGKMSKFEEVEEDKKTIPNEGGGREN